MHTQVSFGKLNDDEYKVTKTLNWSITKTDWVIDELPYNALSYLSQSFNELTHFCKCMKVDQIHEKILYTNMHYNINMKKVTWLTRISRNMKIPHMAPIIAGNCTKNTDKYYMIIPLMAKIIAGNCMKNTNDNCTQLFHTQIQHDS